MRTINTTTLGVAGTPVQLDGWLSDLQKIASKAPSLLNQISPIVVAVIEDPALPEVLVRLRAIVAMEQAIARKKTTSAGFGAFGADPGVNLIKAIPFLDAYLYLRQHPWVGIAAGAGVVAALFGAGFGVGRLTKRCKSGS